MAQLTLSHTLVPNTPENINDVQDNFDDITAHLNTALVGADNLTSPNYSVARVVRSRRFVRHGRTAASTRLMGTAVGTFPVGFGIEHQVPIWHPVSASLAVTGKTTQVRVRADVACNTVAPG